VFIIRSPLCRANTLSNTFTNTDENSISVNCKQLHAAYDHRHFEITGYITINKGKAKLKCNSNV